MSTVVYSALLLVSVTTAARAQETMFRGFGDVNARFGRSTADSVARTTFALGQIDLFVHSNLSDRFSLLAEIALEPSKTNTDWGLDVERAILMYAATSHVRLAAGKQHNVLGYWNNAYHHGTLLQPTIERPLLVKFEDDGGLLPVHILGGLVSGRDLTPLHLGFDVLLGNGGGTPPAGDNNDRKSITLAVSMQATSTIQVGANYYADQLPAGAAIPMDGTSLTEPLTQRIGGGYVAMLGARAELIAEYQHIVNSMSGSRSTANDGYFVYGGVKNNQWTTYGRFEDARLNAADRYFQAVPNTRLGLIGLRRDITTEVTAKSELRRGRLQGGEWQTQGALQVAFTF